MSYRKFAILRYFDLTSIGTGRGDTFHGTAKRHRRWQVRDLDLRLRGPAGRADARVGAGAGRAGLARVLDSGTPGPRGVLARGLPARQHTATDHRQRHRADLVAPGHADTRRRPAPGRRLPRPVRPGPGVRRPAAARDHPAGGDVRLPGRAGRAADPEP